MPCSKKGATTNLYLESSRKIVLRHKAHALFIQVMKLLQKFAALIEFEAVLRLNVLTALHL